MIKKNILEMDLDAYYSEIRSKLDKDGFALIYLCEPQDKLFLELMQKVVDRFGDSWNGNLEEAFSGRLDKASLDFDEIEEGGDILRQLLSRTVVPRILEDKLHGEFYFETNYSKYRGVNPNIEEQMNYSPLHFDGEFLPGPSYNLCVPFTGYGGPYPGLDIWPNRSWHKVIKKLVGARLFKLGVKSFTQGEEPIVPPGFGLLFDENVLHKRSVKTKFLPRINVEFRFFSKKELNNSDLSLFRFE